MKRRNKTNVTDTQRRERKERRRRLRRGRRLAGRPSEVGGSLSESTAKLLNTVLGKGGGLYEDARRAYLAADSRARGRMRAAWRIRREEILAERRERKARIAAGVAR